MKMKTYKLFKAGESYNVIDEFVGDDMSQSAQQVHIFRETNLVVAMNLEPGYYVAEAGLMSPL
jgi:hypothetical protein